MLYEYKDLKVRNNTGITYFYKPKGYKKYISFSNTYGTTMGTPNHGVDLPIEAVEIDRTCDENHGMFKMLKFLDDCFSK